MVNNLEEEKFILEYFINPKPLRGMERYSHIIQELIDVGYMDDRLWGMVLMYGTTLAGKLYLERIRSKLDDNRKEANS